MAYNVIIELSNGSITTASLETVRIEDGGVRVVHREGNPNEVAQGTTPRYELYEFYPWNAILKLHQVERSGDA